LLELLNFVVNLLMRKSVPPICSKTFKKQMSTLKCQKLF